MEISTTKKYERHRIVAILDAALALCLFVVCSFTLLFVYSINEERVSEVLVVILTVPLILNGIQMAAGIVLLFLTRKYAHYLPACSRWCSVSKYLTAFTFMELFVLLQFQFNSLAFGLFGIQYFVRLVAIQKVRHFMELLILRNTITRRAAAIATRRTPVMLGDRLIATTIVPNNELVYVTSSQGQSAGGGHPSLDHTCPRFTTFGALAGQANAIHVHPYSVGPGAVRPSRGRVLIFDDFTGELHLQCRRHDEDASSSQPSSQGEVNEGPSVEAQVQQEELPPPSYADAMSRSKSTRTHTSILRGGGRYIDAPPSYNEAVRARARMHWRIIAAHRKNQSQRQLGVEVGGKPPASCAAFPPSFL